MKKIYSIAKIGLILSGLQLSYGAIAVSAEPKVESLTPSTSIINKVPSSEVSQLNAEISRDTIDKTTTAQNVTSVSQLSDVRPTDWAFTALQSLVERYGCIAGYPDRKFRGKQATSRYEFAAGLNACLDKINEIISAGLADKVNKQDLATLRKLQEEVVLMPLMRKLSSLRLSNFQPQPNSVAKRLLVSQEQQEQTLMVAVIPILS